MRFRRRNIVFVLMLFGFCLVSLFWKRSGYTAGQHNVHVEVEFQRHTITCPECNVYDLAGNASHFNYQCVKMNIKPTATICLHPKSEDIWVSGKFYQNSIWEYGTVEQVKTFLYAHPNYGLIDIGANIGTYTLSIAATGRNVLAVEPYIENVRRMHKAASLGALTDRITIMANTVSNERGVTNFLWDTHGNIGGMAVKQVRVNSAVDYSTVNYTKSITMNDLLPFCKFKKAVMKIDIEGFEHRAFGQADVLFDNIDIPYVQMEWAGVQDKDSAKTPAEERILFTKMLAFFAERDFIPRTSLNGNNLALDDRKKWPRDVAWVKRELIPATAPIKFLKKN